MNQWRASSLHIWQSLPQKSIESRPQLSTTNDNGGRPLIGLYPNSSSSWMPKSPTGIIYPPICNRPPCTRKPSNGWTHLGKLLTCYPICHNSNIASSSLILHMAQYTSGLRHLSSPSQFSPHNNKSCVLWQYKTPHNFGLFYFFINQSQNPRFGFGSAVVSANALKFNSRTRI